MVIPMPTHFLKFRPSLFFASVIWDGAQQALLLLDLPMSNLLPKFPENRHFIMSFSELYILWDIQEPIALRKEFIQQIFVAIW